MNGDDKPRYTATLRATYWADDDVIGTLVADELRLAALRALDEEAGEDVVVTQVTDTSMGTTPEEIRVILARARNTLIRTRLRRCYDVARLIDEIVFALEFGDLEHMRSYDHGRFMDLTERILKKGENPE